MTCQIIKTDTGKFALYVDGKHIADYTRQSDAKRGYARYLARIARADDAVQPSIFEQPAHEPQTETPLNHTCRITGQAFYLLQQADWLLSAREPQKGAGRPHTPTQRVLTRGAAGAAARSPPLG